MINLPAWDRSLLIMKNQTSVLAFLRHIKRQISSLTILSVSAKKMVSKRWLNLMRWARHDLDLWIPLIMRCRVHTSSMLELRRPLFASSRVSWISKIYMWHKAVMATWISCSWLDLMDKPSKSIARLSWWHWKLSRRRTLIKLSIFGSLLSESTQIRAKLLKYKDSAYQKIIMS